ncbi:hypothetical protein LXA43DRAFT_1182462 [Ganoderma leucocontextum]|nr:hypothetical protein LXA43DRAFT_1182462 [Ganoderma leucocontextum]
MAAGLSRTEEGYKNFISILNSEVANLSEDTLTSICNDLRGTLRIIGTEINMKRPILALPVELLVRIFDELLVTQPKALPHGFGWVWKPPFKDSTALLISQTCRRLRDVALSKTSWWAHVSSGVLIALSCGFHNDSMWGMRTLALDHNQLPVLQYLCLDGVPFRLLDPPLRQRFLSLTHLVLIRTNLVDTHAGVESLLRLCPDLRCIVLSLHLPGARAHEANAPLPTPTSLRRLVLHDLDNRALDFYLSLFPTRHPIALQVLTDVMPLAPFRYEPTLKQRLHGKLTHLRLAVFPHASKECGGYRFSVTLATSSTAVRVASNVSMLRRSVYRQPDAWLESLLSDDAVDLSNLHEAWLVNVTGLFAARLPPFNATATVAALRRMPLLDTLVLVAVEHPNHGLGNVYTPDLAVLLDAAHTEVFMVHLKTLRLVYYDASPVPAHPLTGHESIKLRFQLMLRQLEASKHRYLEHLVVEMSSRFEISDTEATVEELRAHFQTVRINRIEDMPEMPLPPCCVEPDAGPGGSYTWTNPLM